MVGVATLIMDLLDLGVAVPLDLGVLVEFLLLRVALGVLTWFFEVSVKASSSSESMGK
jgi:hypothetical protein